MTAATLRERVKDELRIYAFVSLYLYFWFGALVLYQAALQQADGGVFLPHGVAFVKALVVGKFLLLGRAVGAGASVPVSTGLRRILVRSVALLLVVVVLSLAEELIMGAIHDRSVSETWAELAHRPGLMLVAKSVLVMLIILPLVTLEELDRALGRSTLRRLFFA